MMSHKLARKLLEQPNCEIIMSSDSEGNSYGTINDNGNYSSIVYIDDKDSSDYGVNHSMIILYPFEDHLALEELG